MCAIAGIWNFRSRSAPEIIERFTNSMEHRGPDGFGFQEEPSAGLWLGHRRLAILDLSEAGKQPMSYQNGRYWITFNGEIFNFIEVRNELAQVGHHFHTDTDTEVILAAFAAWGSDCQFKFNGMWAFAIWDREKQELFVARDRFGIKPLYYLRDERWFCFASELKAFLSLPGFTAEENTDGLAMMLRNVASLEPTADTLLKHVHKLRPGHALQVRRDSFVEKRWWNTLDHLAAPPDTLEEQAEQFRELFLDACNLRLRSDVPVATCLSGGLDSSSVLCALAQLRAIARGPRAAHDSQNAFVAAFPGAAQDETEFAKMAIAHSGARGHFRQFTEEDLLSTIGRVIFDFEEISTTLPTPIWFIYQTLRNEGAKVSLDGHGADELLAGYISHRSSALRDAGGLRHPWKTMDVVRTYQDLYSEDGPQEMPGTAELFCEADPVLRFLRKQSRSVASRLLPGPGLGKSHNYKRWLVGNAPEGHPPLDNAGPLSGLNRHLYRDFHQTRLPGILRNFDRCSMAHGVEVRMPFMDWRLVCFLFSLPVSAKVGGGYTKRVLREAMRGILPESIRLRKGKIGFNSPLPEWFSGPLKNWLLATIEEKDFLQSDLWRGVEVRDFIKERLAFGRLDWSESSHVWTLVHAHLWRKHFLGKKR